MKWRHIWSFTIPRNGILFLFADVSCEEVTVDGNIMTSANSFRVTFVCLLLFVHSCNTSPQTVNSVNDTTIEHFPRDAITGPAGGNGQMPDSENIGVKPLVPVTGSFFVPYTSLGNTKEWPSLQHLTENDFVPTGLPMTGIVKDHSSVKSVSSSIKANLQKTPPPPSEPCPGTCQCYADRAAIVCNSGFWHHIPPLPKNYSHFTVENGNITKLARDSFPGNPFLMNVYLNNINLLTIQDGAFAGLHSLKALGFKENKLNTLPTGVFLNTPALISLTLSNNDFQKIPHHSICVANKLMTLFLDSNRITKLVFPPCYQNMSKLHMIDLSDNQIGQVSKNDFKHLRLSPMRELVLKNCKLSELNKYVFLHIPDLKMINLSGNKLSTLPEDIFLNLTNLSDLHIDGNRFHRIFPSWFVNTISVLNLGYNKIRSLNATAASNPCNLYDLTLDSNKLQTLHDQAFSKLELYNLNHLSLRKCSLQHIYPHAFGNLTKLTSLKLSGNKLTASDIQVALIGVSSSLQNLYLDDLNLQDITADTFSYLTGSNITKLILDSSGIKHLPYGAFQNFRQLRTLSLKLNKIIEINTGCFKPLINLDMLMLSQNNLVYCMDTSVAGLSSTLTMIDISGNLIQRLEPKCVKGLDQLEVYMVENNKLRSSGLLKDTFTGMGFSKLDLSYNQLTVLANDTLNNMTFLKELNIRDNKISRIQAGCFKGLSSLSVLNLNNNPTLGNVINSLQIAFTHTPTLQSLDLSSCGIQRLTIGLLHSLPHLNVLILTANDIISWEPYFFFHQISLSILHLRHNRIVTINSSSVQYLPSLREIYLDSNPLICSCNLLQFRDWILSGRYFVDINVNDPKSYACASPPKVKGVPLLLSVDLGFKVCGPIEAIVGGSVVRIRFCSSGCELGHNVPVQMVHPLWLLLIERSSSPAPQPGTPPRVWIWCLCFLQPWGSEVGYRTLIARTWI